MRFDDRLHAETLALCYWCYVSKLNAALGMSEATEATGVVSHFLYSKKALQQGEALCSKASALSTSSAQFLVEALALNAKSSWMTEGVLDQLKLATAVAKSITQQRAKLLEEAREWDTLRAERSQSLDAILESLGAQLVPPPLHQLSSGSSLFGSQHSLSDDGGVAENTDIQTRGRRLGSTSEQERDDTGATGTVKAKWKSLRDFVDERGIEDALERLEEDRNALDDVLTSTSTYPSTLTKHISDVRSALPPLSSSPRPYEALLTKQEALATSMAAHLESLAGHYDQMANAFRDEEGGHVWSAEEMQVFKRDTEELPSIIGELEGSIEAIEAITTQLVTFRDTSRASLDHHRDILFQLEDMGEVMDEMLQAQDQVQADATSLHATLQEHHTALHELEETYHAYQLAYDHLIVEMDRRNRYRDSMSRLVEDFVAKLEAAREDEMTTRERFIGEYGGYLPDDLCPYVPDVPARWVVESEGVDGAALLEASVVEEATKNLGIVDGELSA